MKESLSTSVLIHSGIKSLHTHNWRILDSRREALSVMPFRKKGPKKGETEAEKLQRSTKDGKELSSKKNAGGHVKSGEPHPHGRV